MPPGWSPPGQYPVADLARLMASRRSCRNYLNRPVARDLLEDLVRIGTLAPSGTNSQKRTFTVLADRRSVAALGHGVLLEDPPAAQVDIFKDERVFIDTSKVAGDEGCSARGRAAMGRRDRLRERRQPADA